MEKDNLDSTSMISDGVSSSEVDEKPKYLRKAKFKCPFPYCKEEFRREVARDKHVFKHTGIKQHSCQIPNCGKSYTNSTHLKRHIRASHGMDDPQRINCQDPDCKLVFSTNSSMQKHFKQRHGPNGCKIHACNECEERFTKKAQLKVHMYSHTGNYPQRCQECDAGFLNLKQLRSHIVSHRQPGKNCTRCKINFPNWSAFLVHEREVHTKKYSCPQCPNKVYQTKAGFRKHIQTCQAEPKIFKCPFEECSFTAPTYFRIRRHVRSIHVTDMIKCNICDVRVRKHETLAMHLAKMHPDGTRGIRPQKPRCDVGMSKTSATTQLSGVRVDPEVEKILLAGEGRRMQIQYTPNACAWDTTSATDTESEASSIPTNTFAF